MSIHFIDLCTLSIWSQLKIFPSSATVSWRGWPLTTPAVTWKVHTNTDCTHEMLNRCDPLMLVWAEGHASRVQTSPGHMYTKCSIIVATLRWNCSEWGVHPACIKHKSGKEGWTPVKKKPQSDRAVETGSERAIHTDEQLNLMLGRSRLSWRIDKAIWDTILGIPSRVITL